MNKMINTNVSQTPKRLPVATGIRAGQDCTCGQASETLDTASSAETAASSVDTSTSGNDLTSTVATESVACSIPA